MKKYYDSLSKALFLYNFSIRSRLILYFLFLVLLPTTIISVTIYNKSAGIITRNMNTSIENNFNLVQDNLPRRFEAANQSMTALYLNSEFANLISSNRPTDSTGIINELAALNKILEDFPASGTSGNSFVPMLYMLNRPEYTQYNFSRRVFNIDLITLKPWYLNIPAKADFAVVGLSSLDSRFTLKFAKRLFGIRHAQLPYVGLLTLDIPVAEFGTLLEHYKPTPGSKVNAEPETLGAIVDRLCRLPLVSEPGSELRYSNAGYGIAARLAERVSGREFWALAEARVLEPLGLSDTVVRPEASLLPRFALLADTAHAGTDVEAYNSEYWRQLAIPWGGAYGGPRDLARFAGSFLAGGPRLLSAASVRAMTTDQTEGVPGGVESAKVWWPSGRWGLGWEVKGPKRRHWTGELTSPGTFCHFGAAGTLLWADPEREVALAVFANRMVARMWGYILPRWARLSNAVVAAVS